MEWNDRRRGEIRIQQFRKLYNLIFFFIYNYKMNQRFFQRNARVSVKIVVKKERGAGFRPRLAATLPYARSQVVWVSPTVGRGSYLFLQLEGYNNEPIIHRIQIN